ALIACGGAKQPAESPAGEAKTGAPPASAPSGPTEKASAASPGEQTASGAKESEQPSPDGESGAPGQFTTLDTHTSKDTHGTKASKLTPTKTEALLKLVVLDKDKGPVEGIVISLTGPDGKKY